MPASFQRRPVGTIGLAFLAACGSNASVAPSSTLALGESLTRNGAQTTTLGGASTTATTNLQLVIVRTR